MTIKHYPSVHFSNEINKIIGSLSWHEKVEMMTTAFLNTLTEKENIFQEIFNFINSAKAFDQTQIQEYLIKNADPSKILEFALSTQTVNSTDLLIEYLEYIATCDKSQEEKDSYVSFVVTHAVAVWVNLDIIKLTDWAIDKQRYDILNACLVGYPFHHMAMEDQFEICLKTVLKRKKWFEYATIFLQYPALIKEYDDEFHIKEKLASDADEDKEEIKRFASIVFNESPVDFDFHCYTISLFGNVYYSHCFVDLSNDSFKALQETDTQTVDEGFETEDDFTGKENTFEDNEEF